MNILIYILIAILGISCASVPPMEVKDFKGLSTIKKGDSVNLKWNFANAYYVEIDGIPKKFNAVDSLQVSPEVSNVYKFKAIQDEDTINKSWRVIVMIPEDEQKIQKFPYGTSYTESKYFKGVMDNAKKILPNRLKITNIHLNEASNEIEFNGLITDEFGNYIPGMVKDNKLNWYLEQKCNENSSEIKLDNYIEEINLKKKVNIHFLIDKSAAAEYLNSVEESIKSFLPNLSSNDLVSIYSFDQNLEDLIITKSKKDLKDFNLNIGKSNGLNALYKSSFKLISEIKNLNGKQVIFLINFASNNAATIYNISDVIKDAKANNIQIYMISIGDAIDSFSSKYLAYGSGASYYDVPVDELFYLSDIFNEIYFAQKVHYNFKIPYDALNDCNFDATTITAEFNERKINDQVYLVKKPEWLGSKSQSIALFDYKSSELNNEFDELIESMARVLIDNPGFSLELIGHSSIEGSEDSNQELSLTRAQNVAERFTSYGVKEQQLKLRAEGSSMPIYFLPSSAWQQYYNRRVEVRWLIPEMLPYEIIADEFWTEQEAMDNVTEWRKRGYRSYYERFLVENMPKYKVKLWGYRSIESAKDDISEISSKYDIDARIE